MERIRESIARIAKQEPRLSAYEEGRKAGLEEARLIVLEERCERGTPWDLAVMACAREIQNRIDGKQKQY